jgi:hypothetical protein
MYLSTIDFIFVHLVKETVGRDHVVYLFNSHDDAMPLYPSF